MFRTPSPRELVFAAQTRAVLVHPHAWVFRPGRVVLLGPAWQSFEGTDRDAWRESLAASGSLKRLEEITREQATGFLSDFPETTPYPRLLVWIPSAEPD